MIQLSWNAIVLIGIAVTGSYCLPQPLASTEEIRAVTSRIWDADIYRFTQDEVEYNPNGPRIFNYVDESKFDDGIYRLFMALLDNYIPETGTPEPPCTRCREEEEAWLEALVDSPPMQIAWQFLREKGVAANDREEFKEELRYNWFETYSRSGGPLDSSGFEHVYVGEIRNNRVGGFHSWIQAYLEENKGELEYRSYIRSCPNRSFALRHNWLGYYKSYNSLTVGSSPEAEMALYAVCLRLRMGNGCPVRLAGEDMSITTWDYQGKQQYGTAYIACP